MNLSFNNKTSLYDGRIVSAPHEVNDSERMQFGGKEFESFMGVNLSDFGARHYNSTSGHWLQPDPMQESYFALSPYAYCAGNPIMNIDPNGEDIFVMVDGSSTGHMAILIDDESEGKWLYYSINGDAVNFKSKGKSGRPFDDLGIDGGWSSPKDFLDSPFNSKGNEDEYDPSIAGFNFEKGLLIETTQEQNRIIREEFVRISDEEPYNLASNNCASTVLRAIEKAGIETGYSFPSDAQLRATREVFEPIQFQRPYNYPGVMQDITLIYISIS